MKKKTEESPEKRILSSEIAEAWNLSRASVIKLFSDEPEVIQVEAPSGRRGNTVRELSVPESVLMRVYEDRLSKRSSSRVKPKRNVASEAESVQVTERRSRQYLLKAAQELWNYEHAHGGNGLALEIASFLGYPGDDADYGLQAWLENRSRSLPPASTGGFGLIRRRQT